MSVFGCIAVIALAFWPVWQWYFQRCLDQSDEPLGLLALITLVAIVFWRTAVKRARPIGAAGTDADSVHCPPIRIIISLIVLYVALFSWAPKLVQSVIAVLAVACATGGFSRSRRFVLCAGDCALLLLSLPIVASLNFFGSFPLRILSCNLALPLLSMAGFPCTLNGTALIWHNTVLQIDPPCSGIKFLWFAIYLCAALAAVQRAKIGATILLLLAGAAAAVVGNALRITSLFFLVGGLLAVPPNQHDLAHSGIGLICFALTIALIMAASALCAKTPMTRGQTQAKAISDDKSKATQSPMVSKPELAALACCVVMAACLPLSASKSAQRFESTADFPGWPSTYGDSALHAVPFAASESKFIADFPGKVGSFSDGRRALILRWIPRATRQLHSAADCYSGSGYAVNWVGSRKVDGTHQWSCFTAQNSSHRLLISERIYDQNGKSYADTSAWYWAAMLQQTRGPWWSITIAQPIADIRYLSSDSAPQ